MTPQQVRQIIKDFDKDWIPHTGNGTGCSGIEGVRNVRPAGLERCCLSVAYDPQSGPIYCGRLADVVADVVNLPGCIVAFCNRHRRHMGAYVQMAKDGKEQRERMTSPRWKDSEHRVLLVTIVATPEMRKLAKEALDVQDACNLCGLAQRFAEVMKTLLHHPMNNVGGTWANRHPVVHLWIDKFAHLAGYKQSTQAQAAAYNAVHDLNKGKDVEWELLLFVSDRGIWEEKLREH